MNVSSCLPDSLYDDGAEVDGGVTEDRVLGAPGDNDFFGGSLKWLFAAEEKETEEGHEGEAESEGLRDIGEGEGAAEDKEDGEAEAEARASSVSAAERNALPTPVPLSERRSSSRLSMRSQVRWRDP